MKVTFIRQDGSTFSASFDEASIRSTRKDKWMKEMLRIYENRGAEKEALEAKLSEIYDRAKGVKPKVAG